MKRVKMRSSWEQFDRFRVVTLDRELQQLLMNRLAQEGALDAVDRRRFANLMQMLTYSVENNWELSRQHLDEDGSVYERIAPTVATIYNSPGGKTWWEQSKHFFKPGYVRSIDEFREASVS